MIEFLSKRKRKSHFSKRDKDDTLFDMKLLYVALIGALYALPLWAIAILPWYWFVPIAIILWGILFLYFAYL